MPQVTYIPGEQQQQGDVDLRGFAEMALAVKQVKMQEDEQKRQTARQKLQDALAIYKETGTLMAPKELDKLFKDAGLNYSVDEFKQLTPEAMQGVSKDVTISAASVDPMAILAQAQQSGGAVGLPSTMKPQDVARAGNTMQGNKSGAQAANPASDVAADRAPGGGVTKTAPAPGSGILQHMLAQAKQQYPALAQMYQGALSQQQIAAAQAEREMAITANWNAFDNGRGDWAAGGRAIAMSGGKLDDQMLRALMATAGTPQMKEGVYRFLTGGMTPEKISERRTSVLKDLTAPGNQLLPMLKNKEDVFAIADSIAQGGPLPKVALHPMTLEQQKTAADEAYKWMEYGFPPALSTSIGEKRALGLAYSQIFPEGFDAALFKQGFVPMPERKMRAGEKEAEAKMLTAKAAAQQASNDAGRLALLKDEAKYKPILDSFNRLVEAKKAGVDIDDSVLQEAIAAVAGIPELGMTVKRVRNTWNYLTLGFFGSEYYQAEPTRSTAWPAERPDVQGGHMGQDAMSILEQLFSGEGTISDPAVLEQIAAAEREERQGKERKKRERQEEEGRARLRVRELESKLGTPRPNNIGRR